MTKVNNALQRLGRKVWNSPTITSWSAFAVTTLNFTVLLPMVVKHLSTGDFAVWLLFGSIANFQTFLTLGLTPTFTRLIAYAWGGRGVTELGSENRKASGGGGSGPNVETLERISGTMHRLFIGASLIAVFLALTVGTWLLIRPVEFTSSPAETWVAWSALVVTMGLRLATTGVNCFLMGANHIALLQRWQTFFGVLGILISAAVTVWSGNLLVLILTTQVFAMLNVLRNQILCRYITHGESALDMSCGFDRKIWAVAWPCSWRSGLSLIIYGGFLQSSGLIYAQFANATSVAAYAFALRVMQVVNSFSQAPFYSRIPEMARLYGAGQKDQLLELARRCTKRAYWTFALTSAALLLMGNWLLDIVSPGRYHFDIMLLAFFAVGLFFERISGMNFQIAHVTNRIYSHIGAVGVTAINLVVIFALGPKLGVRAFPLGLVAGQAGFQCWYAARNAGKLLEFDVMRFTLRTAALPFALILGAIAVAWKV